MVKYLLFQEQRTIEGREYDSFGAAAFDENGDIICVVPDITPSKQKALNFIESCEKYGLSPCQLKDAAEDFIISDSY